MSKYTTELRFICEHLAGLEDSEGYNSIDDVLEKSWSKIFSFSFPIWKESERKRLCQLILRHYYTREIGYETYGRWKLGLQSYMLEQMPFYNRLYEAIENEFSLLREQDLQIEHNLNRTDSTYLESDRTNKGSSEYESKYLDTPQGGLDGIVGDNYLTNVTKDDSSNSDTTNYSENTEASGKESWDEHRYGYNNPYNLLEKYKQEIFNIDMQIINGMSDLFMGVW